MQGQCGSLNVEELDEARSDEDDPINHAIWRVGGVFYCRRSKHDSRLQLR